MNFIEIPFLGGKFAQFHDAAINKLLIVLHHCLLASSAGRHNIIAFGTEEEQMNCRCQIPCDAYQTCKLSLVLSETGRMCLAVPCSSQGIFRAATKGHTAMSAFRFAFHIPWVWVTWWWQAAGIFWEFVTWCLQENNSSGRRWSSQSRKPLESEHRLCRSLWLLFWRRSDCRHAASLQRFSWGVWNSSDTRANSLAWQVVQAWWSVDHLWGDLRFGFQGPYARATQTWCHHSNMQPQDWKDGSTENQAHTCSGAHRCPFPNGWLINRGICFTTLTIGNWW